jgi:hypothetical protein
MDPLQQSLEQPGQRRLPRPLRPVQPKHQGPILDVVRNPSSHRDVEIGNERIGRPRNALLRTPSLDITPNIRKLGPKPTAE